MGIPVKCFEFGRRRSPAVLIGLSCLWAAQAIAQTTGLDNPGTMTDFYGNARPSFNERRGVGSFANQIQREILQGYQETGRRTNRRGGVTPFGLVGDRAYRLSLAARSVGYTSAKTSLGFSLPSLWPTTADIRSSLQSNFRQYGGFAPRAHGNQATSLDSILTRREDLIGASALDAPVRRALWRLSASNGLMSYPRSETVPPTQAALPPLDAPRLDDALRARVMRTYARSRSEGWTQFKKGEYRRAIRFFDSTMALDPNDHESRLGQVFCYAATGAMKTTVVTLRQLIRREPNPFDFDLDLTARLAGHADSLEIRAGARRFAQAYPDVEDARALYVLVLWYLGDREAAIREAGILATSSPASRYRGWQARMTQGGKVDGLP